MKFEKVRDGLLQIFNSFGYEYKLYNDEGKAVSNPYEARYMFVNEPNMMFIIDEDDNKIEFHKADFNFKTFQKILRMIRKLAMKYFVGLEVSNYNQSFVPKDFSKDILRRRYNLKRKLDALEESSNSRKFYEKYDDVEIVYHDSFLTLKEGKNVINFNKDLKSYVPYIVEKYNKGKLDEKFLSKLSFVNQQHKALDKKSKRGNLNENERKLYQNASLFLKRIYMDR